MPDDTMVEVSDNAALQRYEARSGGELVGWIDYEPAEGRRILVHTEVPPAFAGRGIAARLAVFALDNIRASGLRVVPRCPYVAAYIRAHPAYRDLVVGMRGTPIGRPSHDVQPPD
jgi:uncharacterized protein